VGTDFAFRADGRRGHELNNWGAIDDTEGSAPCATSRSCHDSTGALTPGAAAGRRRTALPEGLR